MANNEFLPICDVLFNIISLLWYFCNIVFDLVFSYALYNHHKYIWFSASLSFILLSLIINQVISLRCYFKALQCKLVLNSKYSYERVLIMLIHVVQCGVLWRYLKLFIPVDVRYVKHEVRDLCMLRLVHAFCEAAPLLLIQLYLLLKDSGVKELDDLILVSSILSLFSMCWALASFSKNVRLQNVHRLVFTWMGVIFQLLWRLGTVGSRVSALTLYATIYGEWLFLVLGLHWISMFLWLISPKNVFHGEKISKQKKAIFSLLIAFVYIFSYVNLQQVNHRQKMVTFYIVMLLENALLVAVWLAGIWPNFNFLVPLLILVSFIVAFRKILLISWIMKLIGSGIKNYFNLLAVGSWAHSKFMCAGLVILALKGICFMGLYYRMFHVRRLTYWSGEKQGNFEYTGSASSTARLSNKQIINPGQNSEITKQSIDTSKLLRQNISKNYNEKIPGVFNCRFSSPYPNTAKRKKKKPTTFVPPPSVTILPSNNNANLNFLNSQENNIVNKQYDLTMQEHYNYEIERSIPFWKRPLPTINQGGSSENENSSIGSRINIQHKLQEKKQKQLAELKMIEEEIKQGKIQRTILNMANAPQSSLQPIPRAKRHIDSFVFNPPKPLPSTLRSFTYQLLPPVPARWQHPRTGTPEILLTPNFLNKSELRKLNKHTCTISDDERSGHESSNNKVKGTSHPYKMPSDIDSQISLPRSYTLPREFKYYNKTRKNAKVQHFIRSTNSSDGDVDSADESTTQDTPIARRRLKQYQHRHVMHETKL